VRISDLFPCGIKRQDVLATLKRLNSAAEFKSLFAIDHLNLDFDYVLLCDPSDVRIDIGVRPAQLYAYKKALALEESEPFNLSKAKIIFDQETGTLKVDENTINFPPASFELGLCKYLLAEKVGTAISWDAVYEAIQGEESSNKRKDRKLVYDAKNRVNNRLKKELGCHEDLLAVSKNTIRRNH
jgi:hypothetical protein